MAHNLNPELKDKLNAFAALRPGCIEAMEATFALCEAISKNKLTVNDLAEVCRMAIDDGHDMAQVDLAMMSSAITLAKNQCEHGIPEGDFCEPCAADDSGAVR